MSNKLIFDLGCYKGEDTRYYLSKGYSVIAVEPNPLLCASLLEKFEGEVRDGRLTIINKAIFRCDGMGSKIKFFVNQGHPNWGSVYEDFASRDGGDITTTMVEFTTYEDLAFYYGVPYYLKVDTEGMELEVINQVSNLKEKPRFISLETSRSNYVKLFFSLYRSGYRRFQLVNQILNPGRNYGNPSGAFGDDLPGSWVSMEELMELYGMYAKLRDLGARELALGWVDVHAKT